MTKDKDNEGRKEMFIDIDRFVNEGLGGGRVTDDNGLIEDTTTDTMNNAESVNKTDKLKGEEE